MRQLPPQFSLIWHSYLLIGICGALASFWPVPAACATLLLSYFDRRLWQWQRLALAVLIFASSCAYGRTSFASAHNAINSPPAWLSGKSQRICANVIRAQGLPDNRLRVELADAAPPAGEPLRGLCAWTWEAPLFQPLPGQQICITRPIRPVSGFANNEQSSFEASLFAGNIYWRMWSQGDSGRPELSGKPDFMAEAREKLRQDFLRVLWPQADADVARNSQMPQARAIMLALLFGDRQYLNRNTVNDFASATLAHSLALSGQHLSVAALIGVLLVLMLARLDHGLYLRRPRRLLVLFFAVPLALLYLWIGNSPASLQRAAGMLVFAAFWLGLGKPFSGQDLLCSALLVILALNPLSVFDVGLQMSALCVGTIVISWPAISKRLPHHDKPKQGGLRHFLLLRIVPIVVVSLLIQLALLPLSLARFQIAGFWFPLNIIWLPLLAFIVLPGAIIALIFSTIPLSALHIASGLIAGIACWPAQIMLDFLQVLRGDGLLSEPAFMIPHWTALLGFSMLVCGLAWLWGNPPRKKILLKSRASLCAALALLAIAPALRIWGIITQAPTLEALDTGQSQAILVTLPGDIRILVDGGGSYFNKFDPGKMIVAPYLLDNRPPKLSAVFNSHPDMDHLGGLFHILDHFQVEHVFHNGREANKGNQDAWNRRQRAHNAKILQARDAIIIGAPRDNIRIDILHPPDDSDRWRENGASLIMRLSKAKTGLAIFPGDAEKENLLSLLAQGADLRAKIVFAPHHGSDRNMQAEFYAAVGPEAVIACCGYLNRWNYPGKNLREWLLANRIKLFDTGSHGKISVVFDAGNRPAIRPMKEDRVEH